MTAEARLSALAIVLVNKGWLTLPQFEHADPYLRVTDARVPQIGETVMLVPAPNISSAEQVPWFKSSMGVLFAPCTAPERAADAIHFLLSPWVAIALRERRNPREPHR
jgi:hypothetical protein